MLCQAINTIIQRIKISAGGLHPSIDIGVAVKYPLAVVIALCLVYQRPVEVDDH